MFGKGDVEGVFLSKRDVGRLQTAGVAWAIEERGDHRVLSEASGTCVFLDPENEGLWDLRRAADAVPELPLHAGQRLANRYSFTVEHGARALSWYRYRTILRQATHSKVSSGSRPAW